MGVCNNSSTHTGEVIMSAHVNYDYVVTQSLPVVTRAIPKQAKRAMLTLLAGQQEIDVNHVLDSIMVSTRGVSTPEGYTVISCSIMGQVTKKIGEYRYHEYDVIALGYPSASLIAAFQDLFKTDAIPCLRIEKCKDRDYKVSVRGDMSDYTVGWFNAEQAKIFIDRVSDAIDKMMDSNPNIRNTSERNSVLFGLKYQYEASAKKVA
jgi:hypothetical protein